MPGVVRFWTTLVPNGDGTARREVLRSFGDRGLDPLWAWRDGAWVEVGVAGDLLNLDVTPISGSVLEAWGVSVP